MMGVLAKNFKNKIDSHRDIVKLTLTLSESVKINY